MLPFLAVWVLLRATALVSADATEIPVTFYTDNACVDASTLAKNITIPLEVCTVTPGLGSFVLNPFPCSSGNVVNYVFTDTACGNPEQYYFKGADESLNSNCYGRISGDMAALILSCNQESPGTPTSTTTISVGAIAGVAPPTSTSSTSKSSNKDDSPSADGDGAKGSPAPSSQSSPSSSASSSSSGWYSLEYGARVGIIVSLCVGIPPIIIGILTLYAKKKKKSKPHPIYQETHPFHNIRSAPPSSGYV